MDDGMTVNAPIGDYNLCRLQCLSNVISSIKFYLQSNNFLIINYSVLFPCITERFIHTHVI